MDHKCSYVCNKYMDDYILSIVDISKYISLKYSTGTLHNMSATEKKSCSVYLFLAIKSFNKLCPYFKNNCIHKFGIFVNRMAKLGILNTTLNTTLN